MVMNLINNQKQRPKQVIQLVPKGLILPFTYAYTVVTQ